MTRKQLRERVINEIGLQDIEDYDETVLVDDLIYQGAIDLLARTRCTVRCVHLKTKADESTYTLDKSILALVDVEDGGAAPAPRRERGAELHAHPLRRPAASPTPREDGEVDVWAVLRPQQMADGPTPRRRTSSARSPTSSTTRSSCYACWMGLDYADDESGGHGERYRMLYEGQDTRGGRIAPDQDARQQARHRARSVGGACVSRTVLAHAAGWADGEADQPARGRARLRSRLPSRPDARGLPLGHGRLRPRPARRAADRPRRLDVGLGRARRPTSRAGSTPPSRRATGSARRCGSGTVYEVDPTTGAVTDQGAVHRGRPEPGHASRLRDRPCSRRDARAEASAPRRATSVDHRGDPHGIVAPAAVRDRLQGPADGRQRSRARSSGSASPRRVTRPGTGDDQVGRDLASGTPRSRSPGSARCAR